MEQHNQGSTYRFLAQDKTESSEASAYIFTVARPDGTRETLSEKRLRQTIGWACFDYKESVDSELILQETLKNVFDGISPQHIADALVLAASSFIERDPAYSKVAVRLKQKKLFRAVTGTSLMSSGNNVLYVQSFINGIIFGIEKKLLDSRLKDFDLDYLASHLVIERDSLFDYMGISTLSKRYFLKHENKRIELPQSFWMRVAMGLSYNEADKNEAAIAFYNVMSQLDYVPSTPTLLHAGLTRPQLSSCFLSTVQDDLVDIFKSYSDSAQLAKWSGGVAVDWTNIRACGAMVNSIKTESQGVVPYLKINNDVVAAINRSGKRRSAAVVYLETWHLEIEDFLDLRRNTGDERRRTHDINTANWIPDLFMKRVEADGFDYVYADSVGRRLYIPRRAAAPTPARVTAFDLDTLAPVGEIADTSAAGAAADAKSNHGFASSKPVAMWDTKTLKLIKTIDVQGGPDGILDDPFNQRVYIFSHSSPNATVINAIDGSVLGTIDLGGAPEQAVTDGAGHLYVDIEDKDNVAVVDAKTMTVTAHYDISSVGKTPAGLAFDVKNHILFVACRAAAPGVMVMLNANDGKIISTLPLGGASDGAVFNPFTMEAFSSSGAGNGVLTIIKENSPTGFVVEQSLETMTGAKTLTFDSKTNHILLIAAEYGPAPAPTTPPAAGGRGGGRGSMLPDSFSILVVGK